MKTHRHMVLRTTSGALHGRLVWLLRVASDGRLVAVGASGPITGLDPIERDIMPTVRGWGLTMKDGDLWIACPIEDGRWQVARVRREVPAPPPDGAKMRSADRLTLELAGLLLGALEHSAAAADQSTVYLCAATAVLESCIDRVRENGMTTAARARLLADLASIATAIEAAQSTS
jgi:hypothetical protein